MKKATKARIIFCIKKFRKNWHCRTLQFTNEVSNDVKVNSSTLIINSENYVRIYYQFI